MSELGNLKLDTMDAETQLAENYLKQLKHELQQLKNSGEIDTKKNHSYCLGQNVSRWPTIRLSKKPIDYSELKVKYRKLAKKIEENLELFYQLEFSVRKIPKDDVKNDVDLLIQNLVYCSSNCKKMYIDNCLDISEQAPLADLGHAAHLLMAEYTNVGIISCNTTASVCFLFTQLCHEVGLERIKIILNEEPHFNISRAALKGCTGVVTERSDLDSAVDAFLSCTTKHPWKLRRVFIQESVYESFKKAITWKRHLRSKDQDVDTQLKHLCTDVLVYDDKTFLLEYAGDLDNIKENQITVEAYRTTKELLSLMKKQETLCLTLWSSDISEANEIAFESTAPVVWINDYGSFDGPAKSSQVYYDNIKDYSFRIPKIAEAEKLIKAREAWLKLEIDTRKEKTFDAIEKFKALNIKQADFVNELQESVNSVENNFVDVKNGKMCIGIEKPVGLVYFGRVGKKYDYSGLLKSIIVGNGILAINSEQLDHIRYTCDTKDVCESEIFFRAMLDVFEKVGLPVVVAGKDVSIKNDSRGEVVLNKNFYRTKVVRTNFGTTFAN